MSIGVDFGGTRIKAGVVRDGAVVAHASVATPKGRKAVLDAIAKLIKSLDKKPPSVGLALPGEVDEQGVCWRLPNVPGFAGVNILRELTRRLGCPVACENDATAAALAERVFGHGTRERSFLLVTLGTGVGGGLCIDGVVRRGRHGFAGEIGHVLVDSSPSALKCGCGARGCMEAYAGTAGVLRVNRELGGKARNLEQVALAARRGEKAGLGAMASMGKALGLGLGSLQNTLDLDAVVFSGGASASLDLIEPALRAALRERAFAAPLAQVRLCVSALGQDAGIVGATLIGPVRYNE
jgi:glucokinase